MKNRLILLLLLVTTLATAQNPGQPAATGGSDPKTLPVLWQQTAAEYRALCYQAFNLATLRINAIPAKEIKKKKLTIITDLDETILDNSPQEAQLILDHMEYNPGQWKEWTNLHAAPAVPGAVEFLKAAHARGITVFYVSNRDTTELNSTLANLKMLSLPDADYEHMLFMGKVSSKEARRQKIMEKYTVVMLVGDNLNDFTTLFEKKGIADRLAETDKVKDEWGRKFIVLPNSTYGEWENALYGYRRGLSPAQKDSARVTHLKGYK